MAARKRHLRRVSLAVASEFPAMGHVLRAIRSRRVPAGTCFHTVRADDKIVLLTAGPRGGAKREVVGVIGS